MSVLQGYEPEKVFYYFEQIASIPHGSRDTKRISDYICLFAERRGLEYYQDSKNNVIIRKNGTNNNEDSKPVILQGHIDMVCEKEDWCDIDFTSDGLSLKVNDGIITADGTTLGGDDGIAVAYMLAILDSDDIPHPPLECVFTVDEEIGMLGAAALDMSRLKGKYLLNIDSEDEGHILVSCAGGATVKAHIPYNMEINESAGRKLIRLTVSGLAGGHSGVEIDKGRANSNVILGRALNRLKTIDPTLRIVSLNGGLKDNAIPRSSTAFILINDITGVTFALKELEKELNNVFKNTDPDIKLTLENMELGGNIISNRNMDNDSTERVITALYNMPNGIIRMSFDTPGLVETSLNLGILETSDGDVSLTFSVRSSVESEKNELINRIKNLTAYLGGIATISGEYPAWEYKKDSRLRDIMAETFTEIYGHPPIIESIHAGVECGLFAGKIPGLDAVSFGPDMKDIHTPKESMDIESVRRTWEYLLKVLERL